MSLYNQLSRYEINLTESPIHQSSFLPLESLERNITKSNVNAQLPCSSRIFHPGLSDKIIQNAAKILAILVLISEPRAIQQLVQDGLRDYHLPLSNYQNNKSNSILVSKDGTQFRCFASWDRVRVRDFLAWQWAVLAPVFEFGQHIDIDAKCPLPLISCTEVNEAPGLVYKGTIHSAHLKGLRTNGHLQVAIKELKTEESFEKEKANLEKIQPLNHKHLIKHIATCARAPTYYVIFPWADGGNLGQFWKLENSNRNRGLALWSLHQMLGLAGALVALHKQNCRHGDLKPENILHFKEGSDTSRGNSKGLLVISDVGVSKFHKESTRLRSAPTDTRATTPTYEAPETHDPKDPRSRRWDMWSMGCMFLEYTVWLLYGHEAMMRFRRSRKSDDPKIDRGSFYIRVKKGQNPVHQEVRNAFDRIREDPCCQEGTALGDLVSLISEKLLVQLEDRVDAEELFEALGRIVRESERRPEYLRVEFDSPGRVRRFLEF